MDMRTVKFFASQGAEDLFLCQENQHVYIRQCCDLDHVCWLTSSKWSGGYEPCNPLKADIVIRVVDSNNALLFEEVMVQPEGYNHPVAVKAGLFSSEAIAKEGKNLATRLALSDYSTWKSWLMKSAKEYGFSGYADNWLYSEVEYSDLRPLYHFEYLGIRAYAMVETAKHKLSGHTWNRIEIRARNKADVLYLCGFQYEEG